MTAPTEELFVFGRIVGAHGLRGDLRVRPATDGSDALCAASVVYLRDPGGRIQPQTPVRTALHKGLVLVRLRDLESIDLVAGFIGCEVLMRLDELPDLPDDEHYWHQLQGLAVFDRQHGALGTLQDLLTTAAHDIYVVQGPYGEVLIPVVPAMVLSVDLDGRRIEVDLPDGLVPQPDED